MLNALENNVGFFKKQHLQFCNSLKESDLSDFASLSTSEEKFLFVYNNPVVRSNQVSKSIGDKNLDVSKQLKADGNKAFQANDYFSALFKYSKSVLKCPQDNEESLQELSIILANRSAVFYHIGEHQHALEDIQTSLDYGYPSSLLYKIFDRKARCLLALKQHKSAVEAFRKTLLSLDDAKLPADRRQKWQKDVQIMLAMLSKNSSTKDVPLKEIDDQNIQLKGKPNRLHPTVSDSVTFKETENLGRYAEATNNIKAGDIIVIERPHCSALLSERSQTHCFHCFRRLIAPYPCSNCSNVAFCSKKCLKTAMATHHAIECNILPTIWASGVSITCHMALRMFTQKNLDYFKNIKTSLKGDNLQLGKDKFNYTDYRSVYFLERNESQRTAEDFLHRSLMAVFLFKCLQTAGFFLSKDSEDTNRNGPQFLTDDEVYIGGLILHNLQFLQFNAHEVSELEMKGNDMDKSTSIFLGGAIYPTLSLFNHSCNPAIVRYFQGNTVIGQAIRTTYEGEMVAENYGPNFTRTPKTERQSTLKNQYWFNCNCIACEENWPLFDEMDNSKMRFRCETTGCKNVLIVPTDTMKFMALCPACNQHMNLLKGLKALEDTDSMFRVARSFMTEGDIKKALEKFIELLQMLEETLSPPFRDFHLCQQAARTCMLALGNKSTARTIK